MRAVRRTCLVLVAACALAGCTPTVTAVPAGEAAGLDVPSLTATPSVVPAVTAVATPAPTPPPAATPVPTPAPTAVATLPPQPADTPVAPACRAADVGLTSDRRRLVDRPEGDPKESLTTFHLTNNGPAPCSLNGWAGITAIGIHTDACFPEDAPGCSPEAQERERTRVGNVENGFVPGPTPFVVLGPGQLASFTASWLHTPLRAVTIHVRLPGDDTPIVAEAGFVPPNGSVMLTAIGTTR